MEVNFTYLLGILFAILAGVFVNLGILLQKKVINQHLDDTEFLRNLTKDRTWVLGMVIQTFIGGLIFYMTAQALIGPALVPALMSAGLIVLAIGSVRILDETLQIQEISGILLMILGIIIYSLSELSIDVASFDMLETGFILRVSISTLVLTALAWILKIMAAREEKFRGIMLAMVSGIVYSLNNIWVGPLSSTLSHMFTGDFVLSDLILFVPASAITAIATVYGIIYAQKSFREGQANILSPLISVPSYLTAIMVYFLIFLLQAPSTLSILYMVLGLGIIIASSFLLARRQVQLEEIQTE